MRRIARQLQVSRLEMIHKAEGRYVLRLADPRAWPEGESTLTLTERDMARFGLDPGDDLLGALLEVGLEAVPFTPEAQSPDLVLITRLSRTTQTRHHYHAVPPESTEECVCRLEARTPMPGGTLAVLPPTFYELTVLLTEGEYRRLRALPAGSALQVTLRRTDRRFRDVVLTWRAALDDARVLPERYGERIVPLVAAMIACLDGDVDGVGHYCGIELEEEREVSEEDDGGSRTWRREYFAVDGLSPRNWEKPLLENLARTDAALEQRFGNRLPSRTVHEFYDHIDTSTWESKQPHPIEEITVGLQAKYVFREQLHLPSIIIRARSVVGNRKACEAACARLSETAAALFGITFDHASLAVEETLARTASPGMDEPASDGLGDGDGSRR